MHEMAICESVRQTLQAQSQAHTLTRVKRVCLEIGPLSGVEMDALRFGFDVVMRGSVAQDAVLEIVACPAEAWCMNCAQTVPIQKRFDACEKCGSYQLQVTSGEELRIKELEVH